MLCPESFVGGSEGFFHCKEFKNSFSVAVQFLEIWCANKVLAALLEMVINPIPPVVNTSVNMLVWSHSLLFPYYLTVALHFSGSCYYKFWMQNKCIHYMTFCYINVVFLTLSFPKKSEGFPPERDEHEIALKRVPYSPWSNTFTYKYWDLSHVADKSINYFMFILEQNKIK